MNIQDPNTRDIFTALIDNRRDDSGNVIKPAHTATKFVDEDNSRDPKIPEIISCDISCLPQIEYVDDSACMAAVRSTILGSLPDPVLFTDAKEALVNVIEFLKINFDSLMDTDASCNGETLDLYTIFDDRLPIMWGKSLEGDDSINVMFERLPFRFPLEFTKFSIGLYSRTNNVFYLPVEYQTSS